ncbi:FecR/PupR family sigma factor regulator [Pseudomonas capeferrum]|uniref:FecR/PupR family sigma factor regulator n=1 Tax=Pseudomonas capeferrum TaxID=1495066 RepID=UPI0015E3AE2E|nr:FecR/PupR family sigma factor regulator [Pseudomonas capeferrum]MBA1204610.1 FecR/PupR family sigma factor regulator [Pseudomonas capeferrum]
MSPMPALQHQPDPERKALDWFSRLRRFQCDEALRQSFAMWCETSANASAYAELERYIEGSAATSTWIGAPRPLSNWPDSSTCGSMTCSGTG